MKTRGSYRVPVVVSVVLVLLFAGALASVSAQAVGGGISVFVPTDMFQGKTGSISFETSMETALGLGDYLSIPVGVAYNQVYGSAGTGELDNGEKVHPSGPWFYSDSLLTYLLAQVHIPVGPVYMDIFGGGAANWNISLRPLSDRIARDLQDAGAFDATTSGTVAVTDLNLESGLGYGWVAGASLGVRIDMISIGVTAAYRHVLHDLEISGTYFRPNEAEGDFTIDELQVLMSGVSIGINGSIEL